MNVFYFSSSFFFCFLTLIDAQGHQKTVCLDREEAVSMLETANDFLSKAGDVYPSCKNRTECGGKMPLTYIEISKKLVSDVKEYFPKCSKVEDQNYKPKHCSEILANGRNESGVYTIWPSETSFPGKPLKVYCDMKTDYGGWTMIQRRGKFRFQQDFFQDWESYKNGFGNITEEFWLGNENIRILCYNGCELRFDLQAYNGSKRYAVYKNFNLTRDSYTIYTSHYSGDAGDSMVYHNNHAFSTKDKGSTARAIRDQGGWWYYDGGHAQLNGIYQPGASGWINVFWWQWLKYDCLYNVEMKVRPK